MTKGSWREEFRDEFGTAYQMDEDGSHLVVEVSYVKIERLEKFIQSQIDFAIERTNKEWMTKGNKLIEGVCGGVPPTEGNERAHGFIEGLRMIMDSRDLKWNPILKDTEE